jgi:hypothetical protein
MFELGKNYHFTCSGDYIGIASEYILEKIANFSNISMLDAATRKTNYCYLPGLPINHKLFVGDNEESGVIFLPNLTDEDSDYITFARTRRIGLHLLNKKCVMVTTSVEYLNPFFGRDITEELEEWCGDEIGKLIAKRRMNDTADNIYFRYRYGGQ